VNPKSNGSLIERSLISVDRELFLGASGLGE
jgi:hypothetical protein